MARKQQTALNETRLPGTDIVTRWELVTPERAKEFLTRNSKNRKVMPTLASLYAEDMAAGDWAVTHQGAAVDVEGNTMDAAHRMEAIVLSGIPQWMLITTGLPVEAREAMDRGKLRSLAHTLQIMGYDHDNRSVAMARSMYQGPWKRRTRLTGVGMRKFIDQHAEALTSVRTIAGYHEMLAGFSGVLARAYYHAPGAQIARFVAAMRDEIPADEQRQGDQTARKLGVIIVQARSGGRTGGATRTTIYRKAQNALRWYLAGEDKKKLEEWTEDLFPLPDDGTDEVKAASPP